MDHCLVAARILPFLILPLHPSPPPAPSSTGWIDWHLSLAPGTCPLSFGGGTCPMSCSLRDLSWWGCHHLETASGCSRRKGSKIFISRWTPVHILLTTERCGKAKLEESGNYHSLPYRQVERKRILGNITLESPPPRGAALFVNNLPSLNTVLSPFIAPKHH